VPLIALSSVPVSLPYCSRIHIVVVIIIIIITLYEEGDITVLWNQAVHTVTANRPDIIIKNKKEKTCTLIDVAIPAD
jgi:hypothetical protein